MGTTTLVRRAPGLRASMWVLVAMVVGCSDRSDPTAPGMGPPPLRADAVGNTVNPDEPAAMRELTRATALAMRDAGVRQRVGREMRDHGVTREHKLEFRQFVKGDAGGILLAKMRERSGIDRDSLLRLIAAVRPLEFYMPVRAHRQRWRGEDVLVASQLRDSDPIIAFDEGGHDVAVGVKAPPVTPTFTLVPVETDFAAATVPTRSVASASTSTSTSTSTRQPSGRAHYDLLAPCDPSVMLCDGTSDMGGGTTPTIPSSAPTGLYLTYTDLYDAKEPWAKGDPEIEAYVMGPSAADPTSVMRPLQCSGQNQSGWYRFDQNLDQWSGAVLLFTQGQMLDNNFSSQLPDNRQFAVSLYEDDYQSCVIHDDASRLLGAMGWAATWAYKSYGLLADCSDVVCGAIVLTLYGSEVLKWTWSVATTNDDFLGLAINRAYVPSYSSIYATHALMDGTTLNGGVALQWHVYGQ